MQRTKIEFGTGNLGGPGKSSLGNEVARCRGRGNQVGGRAVVINTISIIGDDGVGNVNDAITVESSTILGIGCSIA